MQVTIGSTEVDLSASGIRTLGELIEAVQQAAADKNEVIVGVSLNGERLGPEEQMTQADRELAPDDRAVFEVQDARAVLTAALEETRDSLPGLEDKLGRVAVALQSGSRQEAFSLFSDCLARWRQVILLLQISQACLGYDPDQIEIEGRSVQELNGELLAVLQQTKEAMEQGDLVALSDLLEYELVTKIRQEHALLDRLIGMVP
jgi:hypothetical protein